MSTTARKARKRQRHDDLALRDALIRRGLPSDSVYVHPKFQHPAKTGTPLSRRAATLRKAQARAEKLTPGILARIANIGSKVGRRWGL